MFIVRWSDDTCSAKLDDDGETFPATTIFDIDSPTNKPAFTFYSRHHIKTTKIPELEAAVDSQIDVVGLVQKSLEAKSGGDNVCCKKANTNGYCLPGEDGRKCAQKDLDHELEGFREVFMAEINWLSILQSADDTKNLAIKDAQYGNVLNWFKNQEKYQYFESSENTEREKDYVRMETGMTEYSQLAPESLTSMMTPIDRGTNPITANTDSAKANRIQFSGSSGEYTLTLDRASSEEYTTMTCLDSGAMKALDLWSKIVGFNPLDSVIDAALDRLAAKFRTLSGDEKVQAELKEKFKKQDQAEESYKRMEAIKKMEDEKKAKLKAAKEEEKRIQDAIDNEEDPKKRNQLIKEKNEAAAARVQAEKERVEALKEKGKRIREERERNKKNVATNDSKDGVERKNALKEQKEAERDGKNKPDRKQTDVAEQTGKKQVWKGGSFLENAVKNIGFAFSSGPIVIASMIAGCNSVIESDASPADLDLSTTIFGVGVEAGFFGGKSFYVHNFFPCNVFLTYTFHFLFQNSALLLHMNPIERTKNPRKQVYPLHSLIRILMMNLWSISTMTSFMGHLFSTPLQDEANVYGKRGLQEAKIQP